MRRAATTFLGNLLRACALLAALGIAGCDRPPAPDLAYRHVEGGDAERGRMLTGRYQCGSCHSIPEAPLGDVRAGPSLEGFGRRSYIGGQVPNGPDTLQRWLREPQALLPTATMPDLGVSADDARDIAAYLLSLK
jgi:cytochrome c2